MPRTDLGENINQEIVNEAFDHALLTDGEMRMWGRVVKDKSYMYHGTSRG